MKKFLAIFLLLSITCFANDVIDQARKLSQQEKIDEALKLLNDYEKTHPDDLDVHNTIQNIMTRHGKKAEAIAQYKQRSEQHPSAFNSYLYLSLLDVPSEREKGFREIVEKYPNEVWGYYGLGTALLDQDNLEEAVGEAKDGLDKVKNPSRIHYVLARIYRRMQHYSDAALHMQEFYKLEPTKDNRETMIAYDHLEITNEEDPKKKFALAQQYFARYNKDLLSGESPDASSLAEVLFVYADNNSTAAPFSEMLKQALDDNTKEDPTSQDDIELHKRVRGALMSLDAWAHAKANEKSKAEASLLEARKNQGSETFYYTAVTEQLLGNQKEALKDAIRAACYPPVYPQAKKLAGDLWKGQHSSDNGFDAALHQQREVFSPERKARVVSQFVSEKAPTFEMMTADDKKITPKDLSGKIVLMNFWAVWCPPCREELPHWNEFYAAHKNDKDVVFAAVGDEPWETIRNYMKNKNFNFPVYRNEKYWDEFKVDGIPTMVIIDPSGVIRFRNSGFEEGLEYAETLQWQIEAVRNKK